METNILKLVATGLACVACSQRRCHGNLDIACAARVQRHEVADARMRIFGVLGLLANLAFLVIVGLGTLESHLGLIALIAQVLFLILYTMYSQPINVRLKQTARSKLVQ